jgi:hypothetical protein
VAFSTINEEAPVHGPRRHLTYANFMSTLAVVLVVGGGAAYAANTVFGSDIVNGEVKTADIGTGEVTTADLANGGVATADLADDSVNSNKIPAGAVQTSEIRNGQVRSADVLDDDLSGADVDETSLNGGGDVSGPLSNLQIGPGTIGRSELASGGLPGVISFFEFSVPANGCQTKVFGDSEANLGEILIAYPESSDLGPGVYMRPTVVAHPGEGVLEICNGTGAPVTIPFGTFFQLRLVA